MVYTRGLNRRTCGGRLGHRPRSARQPCGFETVGVDCSREIISYLSIGERDATLQTCRWLRVMTIMLTDAQIGDAVLARTPDEDLPLWFPPPHWTTCIVVKRDWRCKRPRFKIHPSIYVPEHLSCHGERWIEIFGGFGSEWQMNP